MELKKENAPEKSYALFFVVTTALLAVCGCLLFLLPQRAYSENENRYLTMFQPVSLSGFMDGSVQKNLSDGANDQFLQRDLWMKFATELQRTAGFQDIGGVYFGKDGCYFERVLDSDISKSRYANNLRYLEQFAVKHNVETTLLAVPSAGIVRKDLLPENAVLYDAGVLYEQAGQLLQHVTLLDIRPQLEMKSRTSQVYFKTDHHWTMEGAYQAYAAWCNMHGTAGKELSAFSPECVSRAFFGTLYSKAPAFGAEPDVFMLPQKTADAEVLVNGKKADGIYQWEKLETKDKYGIYFGGNFGKVEIIRQDGKAVSDGKKADGSVEKKLLLIKDSFANSVVPFLMEHYNKIIMLDLRYYNESVAELLQKEQPKEALFLYEISNFTQDMNLFKILK